MSSSNHDPFEEFEFRPINEGLGFHRKPKAQSSTSVGGTEAVTVVAPVSKSSNAGNTSAVTSGSTSLAKSNQSSKSASTRSTPSVFQAPLARTETEHRPETKKSATLQVPTIEDDSISKAQSAVNEILKSLNHKRQLDFVSDNAKNKNELKKSRPQLFAALLDGMLITAAFLMSLIVMLTITKVDLFLNLSHPDTSGMVYGATAALFAAVTFIYMVVNRAFAGYTPGEWAFDQCCGQENQDQDLSYIPRLAFRTLLVMATGFVILPFISYLMNKDIAGQLSGVSLFKKA